MLCFEVYRNDKRVCSAGIGDLGVLTAIVSWASHHPEAVNERNAAGQNPAEPKRIELAVEGLESDGVNPAEHLRWAAITLENGDEIRIRLTEATSADPPLYRYCNNPDEEERRKKAYVLRLANEFGWEIRVK